MAKPEIGVLEKQNGLQLSQVSSVFAQYHTCPVPEISIPFAAGQLAVFQGTSDDHI
jgi:hypothetical protein